MARKAQAKYRTVDLTVPAKIPKRAELDCFGREWSITATECISCHDCLVCCTVFQDTIIKVKSPRLSLEDFTLINEARLTTGIRKTSGQITVEQLLEAIMSEAKSRDAVAASRWMFEYISNNKKVYVKEGKVHYKA